MRVVPVRRLIIASAIAAALLSIYALLGFLLVPQLLHDAAVDTVRKRMDRQLALGEIRFNPFTFTLEVHNLQVPDIDGAVLVGFRRLLVNAELASLWHRAPVLSNLEIDEPTATATIRPGGRLNLADLAQGELPVHPLADRVDGRVVQQLRDEQEAQQRVDRQQRRRDCGGDDQPTDRHDAHSRGRGDALAEDRIQPAQRVCDVGFAGHLQLFLTIRALRRAAAADRLAGAADA